METRFRSAVFGGEADLRALETGHTVIRVDSAANDECFLPPHDLNKNLNTINGSVLNSKQSYHQYRRTTRKNTQDDVTLNERSDRTLRANNTTRGTTDTRTATLDIVKSLRIRQGSTLRTSMARNFKAQALCLVVFWCDTSRPINDLERLVRLI